jgi:HEAT repeat protein
VRAALVLLAALPLVPFGLVAQPKLLVNAQTDTRSAAAGLDGVFRTLLAAQPQPAWIGYSLPAVRTWNLGCDIVRDSAGATGVVHLEPPDQVVVLIRVEGSAAVRVRAVSPDCEIDAGGLPVHWLNDVAPAQSIALLASLAQAETGAVSAIAMHADAAADAALEQFVAPAQPLSVRQRAVSCFGWARGRRGLEVLRRLATNDADMRVRERAVSALASSREPEAAQLLISFARSAPDSRLRARAVGDLGRKSGPEVVAALTGIIRNEQDQTVRKRAFSALEAMPDGEGVSTLVEMAKSAPDAETRKQAMLALEHSRDPRASALFEDVLAGR